MSCEWRFECADCRTSYATERNHGERPMAAILVARPALAHLAAHEGHQVRLINEFGQVHGTCGARVPCAGGCGHERRCALPPEHQGGHDPEAKATESLPQIVTNYLASRPPKGPQCRCPPGYQAKGWRLFPGCEIHTEANRVRGLLLALGFKKFRADGWPLCPTCEEDEVYTLATDQAQLRDLLTHAACYRCGRAIVDRRGEPVVQTSAREG